MKMTIIIIIIIIMCSHALAFRMSVLWDVTPCSLVTASDYRVSHP
jgi:hypothetical protein